MFYSDEPGLTYDDVLLMPGYSEVLPNDVSLSTRFSKNIAMNIPIASSAMDTVTEAKTAVCMAQEGGIGIIHKNLSIEDQASEIEKVKKYVAGMVVKPITVNPNDTLAHIFNLMREHNITGFPVIEAGKLVGIISNRDFRFETNTSLKVKDLMTKENLVTAKEGTSLEEAKKLLSSRRVEKLPVVDANMHLKGLITFKDIEKTIAFPNLNKDALGRLRVGGAVGVSDTEYERATKLIEAGADVIIIDTAHGHSRGVIEMLKSLKKLNSGADIVAGNIATRAACADLIKAGADGIKVGIGPGSICTTRIIAGIGVPQLQAIMDCRDVCREADVPYIADGGIKFSGDITKALAAGASSVMLGSLFAGTDESPGEMVIYQGRAYKVYRGMGSLGAMVKGSKDRYGQADVQNQKLVPEGIEGQVPYRGSLSENVHQLTGGVRSGMGYVGAANLEELKKKGKFTRITSSSLAESHPHDIKITKEAPNYRT